MCANCATQCNNSKMCYTCRLNGKAIHNVISCEQYAAKAPAALEDGQECTVVLQAQITMVYKAAPDEKRLAAINKQAYADALKRSLDADDVVVSGVKYFIRDKQ